MIDGDNNKARREKVGPISGLTEDDSVVWFRSRGRSKMKREDTFN